MKRGPIAPALIEQGSIYHRPGTPTAFRNSLIRQRAWLSDAI